MHTLDFDHFYPRYGAAAALVALRRRIDDVDTTEAAARLAADALDRLLGRFFFEPFGDPTLAGTAAVDYRYLSDHRLDPGKASGQIASRGFYLAPHAVTANGNAARSTIKSSRVLRHLMRGKVNFNKRIPLGRGAGPLTGQINARNPNTGSLSKSVTEPFVSPLEAAFTAIATLTDLKPADWRSSSGGSLSNHALIPDLPLVDGDATPLLDFVEAFRLLRDTHQSRGGHTATLKATDAPENRTFPRPPVYRGNYPGAPHDPVLGPLSLLAAIGRLARDEETIAGHTAGAHVRDLLDALADAPLYLVSYDGDRRVDAFGHHLVGFAQAGDLGRAVDALGRTVPFGVDPAKRFSDPTAKLFRRAAARFVQTFEPGAFRDFLAFRADYDAALDPILTAYMETQTPPDIVTAARVYGQSLNYAAYRAAQAGVEADLKANRPGRTLTEYKARVLVELESNARGAKSGHALLAQLGTVAGRLTRGEIRTEAGPFMEAVARGEADGGIGLDEAKNLVIAFMRLRSAPAESLAAPDDAHATPSPDDSTAGDPVPVNDLFS